MTVLKLTQEKARIFRIIHVDNLAWLMRHGVRCRSSTTKDPDYREIGNPDLILKRAPRVVPIPPGGTLSDYVPFYFTSRSPMLYNIKTGVRVKQLPMDEIAILTTSLHTLKAHDVSFVFTDRHAYLVAAQFFSKVKDLAVIDWKILADSDFAHDANDIGKMDRYQAEVLVHGGVPVEALEGIICYSEARARRVSALVDAAGHALKVVVNTRYFF